MKRWIAWGMVGVVLTGLLVWSMTVQAGPDEAPRLQATSTPTPGVPAGIYLFDDSPDCTLYYPGEPDEYYACGSIPSTIANCATRVATGEPTVGPSYIATMVVSNDEGWDLTAGLAICNMSAVNVSVRAYARQQGVTCGNLYKGAAGINVNAMDAAATPAADVWSTDLATPVATCISAPGNNKYEQDMELETTLYLPPVRYDGTPQQLNAARLEVYAYTNTGAGTPEAPSPVNLVSYDISAELDTPTPTATATPSTDPVCVYTLKSDNYSIFLHAYWQDWMRKLDGTGCGEWPATGYVKLYDSAGNLIDTRTYDYSDATPDGRSWAAPNWRTPVATWEWQTPSPGRAWATPIP